MAVKLLDIGNHKQFVVKEAWGKHLDIISFENDRYILFEHSLVRHHIHEIKELCNTKDGKKYQKMCHCKGSGGHIALLILHSDRNFTLIDNSMHEEYSIDTNKISSNIIIKDISIVGNKKNMSITQNLSTTSRELGYFISFVVNHHDRYHDEVWLFNTEDESWTKLNPNIGSRTPNWINGMVSVATNSKVETIKDYLGENPEMHSAQTGTNAACSPNGRFHIYFRGSTKSSDRYRDVRSSSFCYDSLLDVEYDITGILDKYSSFIIKADGTLWHSEEDIAKQYDELTSSPSPTTSDGKTDTTKRYFDRSCNFNTISSYYRNVEFIDETHFLAIYGTGYYPEKQFTVPDTYSTNFNPLNRGGRSYASDFSINNNATSSHCFNTPVYEILLMGKIDTSSKEVTFKQLPANVFTHISQDMVLNGKASDLILDYYRLDNDIFVEAFTHQNCITGSTKFYRLILFWAGKLNVKNIKKNNPNTYSNVWESGDFILSINYFMKKYYSHNRVVAAGGETQKNCWYDPTFIYGIDTPIAFSATRMKKLPIYLTSGSQSAPSSEYGLLKNTHMPQCINVDHFAVKRNSKIYDFSKHFDEKVFTFQDFETEDFINTISEGVPLNLHNAYTFGTGSYFDGVDKFSSEGSPYAWGRQIHISDRKKSRLMQFADDIDYPYFKDFKKVLAKDLIGSRNYTVDLDTSREHVNVTRRCDEILNDALYDNFSQELLEIRSRTLYYGPNLTTSKDSNHEEFSKSLHIEAEKKQRFFISPNMILKDWDFVKAV